MKEYGIVSVSMKTGLMGRTLHRSLNCLSLRWSSWVKITDKDLAGKLKKCKQWFCEEKEKSI